MLHDKNLQAKKIFVVFSFFVFHSAYLFDVHAVNTDKFVTNKCRYLCSFLCFR